MRLRPTTAGDLALVLDMEASPDVAPFILPWSRERHLEAIASDDEAHLTILEAEREAGFVLLAGLANEHRSVELRRIAVGRKGEGIGRRAIGLVLDHAFGELGAHRVWLDVMDRNERARRAYAACGFVEEGTLRDALLSGGVYESLVVMSVLAHERANGGPP